MERIISSIVSIIAFFTLNRHEKRHLTAWNSKTIMERRKQIFIIQFLSQLSEWQKPMFCCGFYDNFFSLFCISHVSTERRPCAKLTWRISNWFNSIQLKLQMILSSCCCFFLLSFHLLDFHRIILIASSQFAQYDTWYTFLHVWYYNVHQILQFSLSIFDANIQHLIVLLF